MNSTHTQSSGRLSPRRIAKIESRYKLDKLRGKSPLKDKTHPKWIRRRGQVEHRESCANNVSLEPSEEVEIANIYNCSLSLDSESAIHVALSKIYPQATLSSADFQAVGWEGGTKIPYNLFKQLAIVKKIQKMRLSNTEETETETMDTFLALGGGVNKKVTAESIKNAMATYGLINIPVVYQKATSYEDFYKSMSDEHEDKESDLCQGSNLIPPKSLKTGRIKATAKKVAALLCAIKGPFGRIPGRVQGGYPKPGEELRDPLGESSKERFVFSQDSLFASSVLSPLTEQPSSEDINVQRAPSLLSPSPDLLTIDSTVTFRTPGFSNTASESLARKQRCQQSRFYPKSGVGLLSIFDEEHVDASHNSETRDRLFDVSRSHKQRLLDIAVSSTEDSAGLREYIKVLVRNEQNHAEGDTQFAYQRRMLRKDDAKKLSDRLIYIVAITGDDVHFSTASGREIKKRKPTKPIAPSCFTRWKEKEEQLTKSLGIDELLNSGKYKIAF